MPSYSCSYLKALWVFAAVLLINEPSAAQPVPGKLPDSVTLYPAGARRGTRVNVHVVVEQTPPHAEFFLHGEGVSCSRVLDVEIFDRGQPSPRRPPTEIPIHYPRQWAGEVEVADDARAEVVYWDLFCASGGSSGSLPFVIGELPEHIETESNSTPSTAESVEIPVTLNGQIHGERDLDYYRFSLKSGQAVYCEMQARRLGSRLEPAISLLDEQGRPVPFQEDHLGDDPLIAFRAPQDGTYLLQIGNVSFHGSAAHVYRVNLTHRPVSPYVWPIGAPAGQPTRFSFFAMSGDGDIEIIESELTLPSDSGPVFHVQHDALANTIPLRVLSQEAVIKAAAKVAAKSPVALLAGDTVNGRLQQFEPDTYHLRVMESEPLDIRLWAPDAVSAACLVLMEIKDPAGNTVAREGLTPTPDAVKAYHLLSNPVPGEYSITVQNVGSQVSDHRIGGYQLEVLSAQPDFRLRSGSDCLSVTQGDHLEIPVFADRRGGFSEEIQLRVEGLPDGVTVEDNVIAAGKSETRVKITVPDTLACRRHEIRLTGNATIDDQPVSRPVEVRHRGHDSFGRAIGHPFRDVIALTIRHKPMFRLYCEEAYQYAHRGSVYPYRMTLERLNGFSEPVVVQRGDRQNRDLDGIEFPETTVGEADNDFMMPIYLPETMHINIQSQSQLYTQAYAAFTDAFGHRQHQLAVSEKRNMLRTMPIVMKLFARTAELEGSPGEIVSAELELERTSNMQNAVQLQLTGAIAERFSVPLRELGHSQTRMVVPLKIPLDMQPGTHQLTFRVQGPIDAKPDHTAVSSAAIKLYVH